ncbi:hypothetical protein SKAU_G00048050 [Synaphobranchus kaupii]|uniref:Uncharacterized protein n=1 Tax=Synaphobranchus kaupii TaxID=118154 RepID=A0A9Q1G3S9_SYNKA|nr:hypothetical protein SKAU_G00048050 [Synaphobranchus kaupii]
MPPASFTLHPERRPARCRGASGLAQIAPAPPHLRPGLKLKRYSAVLEEEQITSPILLFLIIILDDIMEDVPRGGGWLNAHR